MASLAENFTANLGRLRAKRRLTQEALADATGLSVSYISMLERGQRTPPLETLGRIAEALGTTGAKLIS
jgi:transcriptional regulator with XRE-family HTH domain